MNEDPETGGEMFVGPWQKDISKSVFKIYLNPLLEIFKLLKYQLEELQHHYNF